VSLGPPYDDSGLELRRGVGALLALLIGAVIAAALVLSGRSLGSGITISVELARTGALRVGDKLRLAGRAIGEVRDATSAPGGSVLLRVFVEAEDVASVRTDSELFVSTPSALGQASLEVGPPRVPQGSSRPVADGERLRGVDPPDLDRLFEHVDQNLRQIRALLVDQRPEIDELLHAGASFMTSLRAIPDGMGAIQRIGEQTGSALDSGRAVLAVLRDAGGFARARSAVEGLGSSLGGASPQLARIGRELDDVSARVEMLRGMLHDLRVTRAIDGFASLRRAVTLVEQIIRDGEALQARVLRGEGTIGAFLNDRELFDDLHETHRLIKQQPLKLLLKQLPPEHVDTPSPR
jgi:ABC-type transporter Mla subunit MlaD